MILGDHSATPNSFFLSLRSLRSSIESDFHAPGKFLRDPKADFLASYQDRLLFDTTRRSIF